MIACMVMMMMTMKIMMVDWFIGLLDCNIRTLEAFLNDRQRYINSRFTYLLSFLLNGPNDRLLCTETYWSDLSVSFSYVLFVSVVFWWLFYYKDWFIDGLIDWMYVYILCMLAGRNSAGIQYFSIHWLDSDVLTQHHAQHWSAISRRVWFGDYWTYSSWSVSPTSLCRQ